jgi:hypothetical protein
MLRELPLFGALAPSLLLYFLAAVPLFLFFDSLAARLHFYQWCWHPPLARFALFLAFFSTLVLSTGP